MKPGFLQFHVPGAYWATPTLFLLEQSSAAGRSAEGSGCQGGRGHLGPARPAGQASPNLSPGLSSPGAEGSQSEGGGGGGCRERASPAEGGRAGPGLSSTETGLPRGRRLRPSFLPAAHPGACTQQPPPARRPVPERGATGAPPTLAPALLCALLLLPPAARGAGAGRPPHPPTPGRARREGGDCGEGGAPPASRGLERAWPGSRRRRAGTRLAPLGARAAQRMLAGCPGLGQLSRPGGPRVRP